MSEDAQTGSFGVASPYVELAVEVFGLLADATRVRIILALRDGEQSVGRLAELVGKSPTGLPPVGRTPAYAATVDGSAAV